MDNPIRYDSEHAIEIAEGVFHLGVQDEANVWANIPYLIVSGDEAAIIDPGSAKPDFFQVVLRKIRDVLDPRRIKHIVVQHQDPDLCAAMRLLEPMISPDYELRCPLEAKLLIQHYGLSREAIAVDDDDTLVFGAGRTLAFAMTPYCHFIGSMVTYDPQSKLLFSSDAFGGFSDSNELYAGALYPQQMSTFLGEYLGSRRALVYALKRLEQLDASSGIEMICPQHGCLIPKSDIPAYIRAAYELEVGGQVDALAKKHGIDLGEVER